MVDFWEGIINVIFGVVVGFIFIIYSLYVIRKENFYRCILIVFIRLDIFFLVYGKIV